MQEEGCIFCKIVNGEIPSTTVYEDTEFKVILDKFPANIGHMLVIPKKHIENIFKISDEEAARVFAVVSEMAKKMQKNLEFEGLNIVQNNGSIAGQSVFHFHIHLIPRYKGDGVNITWDNKKTSDQELEEIRQKILI
ncbi:MAG TPA: HIT family protein [Clostridiales bacterium]|nr:MAG: histidine triad (HIT) protein [Clostridiales bacterium GWD2_32_59]HAN09164.1 HIT family protein [Clostridiales bacterium]